MVDAAAVAVKRIAEIPARPHMDNRIRGRFERNRTVIRTGLFIRNDGILPVPGIGIAGTPGQQGRTQKQQNLEPHDKRKDNEIFVNCWYLAAD
jgi:hypothetical protein